MFKKERNEIKTKTLDSLRSYIIMTQTNNDISIKFMDRVKRL